MKLTVLMDNHTEIDVYHLGEPAVSYWLEADGKRFLFDTGYSDAFLKNAKAMGIDLTTAMPFCFLMGTTITPAVCLICWHCLFPKSHGSLPIPTPCCLSSGTAWTLAVLYL